MKVVMEFRVLAPTPPEAGHASRVRQWGDALPRDVARARHLGSCRRRLIVVLQFITAAV
jgi:hypothetical protein